MLTRDPFRHVDQPATRHARPRRPITTALEITAAMLAIAAIGAVLTWAARPANRPGLGGMVAHAATHAASGFTPRPAPLTHGHGSRAVTRAHGTVRH